jgi:hypothetical protein
MSGYLHRLVARARGETSMVHAMARLRAAAPATNEIVADAAAPAPARGTFAGTRFAGDGAEAGGAAPLPASVAERDGETAGAVGEVSATDDASLIAVSRRELRAQSGHDESPPPTFWEGRERTGDRVAGAREPRSSLRSSAGERPVAAPDVHIHIGRVELAALVPALTPKPAAPSTRDKAPMSLDEYFRQRGRRAP